MPDPVEEPHQAVETARRWLDGEALAELGPPAAIPTTVLAAIGTVRSSPDALTHRLYDEVLLAVREPAWDRLAALLDVLPVAAERLGKGGRRPRSGAGSALGPDARPTRRPAQDRVVTTVVREAERLLRASARLAHLRHVDPQLVETALGLAAAAGPGKSESGAEANCVEIALTELVGVAFGARSVRHPRAAIAVQKLATAAVTGDQPAAMADAASIAYVVAQVLVSVPDAPGKDAPVGPTEDLPTGMPSASGVARLFAAIAAAGLDGDDLDPLVPTAEVVVRTLDGLRALVAHKRSAPGWRAAAATVDVDALIAGATVVDMEPDWCAALASTALSYAAAPDEGRADLGKRLHEIVTSLRVAVLNDILRPGRGLTVRHRPALRVVAFGAAMLAAAADVTPQPVFIESDAGSPLWFDNAVLEMRLMARACQAAARWVLRHPPQAGGDDGAIQPAAVDPPGPGALSGRFADQAWKMLTGVARADPQAIRNFEDFWLHARQPCLEPGAPDFRRAFGDAATGVVDKDLMDCEGLVPVDLQDSFATVLRGCVRSCEALHVLRAAGKPLAAYAATAAEYRRRDTAPRRLTRGRELGSEREHLADRIIGVGVLVGCEEMNQASGVRTITRLIDLETHDWSPAALLAAADALQVAADCANGIALLRGAPTMNDAAFRMVQLGEALRVLAGELDGVPRGKFPGEPIAWLRTITFRCLENPGQVRSLPVERWPALAALAPLLRTSWPDGRERGSEAGVRLLREMLRTALRTHDVASLDAVKGAIEVQRSTLRGPSPAWEGTAQSIDAIVTGALRHREACDQLISGGLAEVAARSGMEAVPMAAAMAVAAGAWHPEQADAAMRRWAALAVARHPTTAIRDMGVAAGVCCDWVLGLAVTTVCDPAATAVLTNTMELAFHRLDGVVMLGGEFEDARRPWVRGAFDTPPASGPSGPLDALLVGVGQLALSLNPAAAEVSNPAFPPQPSRDDLVSHIASLLRRDVTDTHALRKAESIANAYGQLLDIRESLEPVAKQGGALASTAWHELAAAISSLAGDGGIGRRITSAVPYLAESRPLAEEAPERWRGVADGAVLAVAAGRVWFAVPLPPRVPPSPRALDVRDVVEMVRRLGRQVLLETPLDPERLSGVAAAAVAATQRLEAIGPLTASPETAVAASGYLERLAGGFQELAFHLGNELMFEQTLTQIRPADRSPAPALTPNLDATRLVTAVLDLGRLCVMDEIGIQTDGLAHLFSDVAGVAPGASPLVETGQPHSGGSVAAGQGELQRAAGAIRAGLHALVALGHVLPRRADVAALTDLWTRFLDHPIALDRLSEYAPRFDELVALAEPYIRGRPLRMVALAGDEAADVALGCCLVAWGDGAASAARALRELAVGTGVPGCDWSLIDRCTVAFAVAHELATTLAVLASETGRDGPSSVYATIDELHAGLSWRWVAHQYRRYEADLTAHLHSGEPLSSAPVERWEDMLAAAALGFDPERTEDFPVTEVEMRRLVDHLAEHAGGLSKDAVTWRAAVGAMARAEGILRAMGGLAEEGSVRQSLTLLANHVDARLRWVAGDDWRRLDDEGGWEPGADRHPPGPDGRPSPGGVALLPRDHDAVMPQWLPAWLTELRAGGEEFHDRVAPPPGRRPSIAAKRPSPAAQRPPGGGGREPQPLRLS